MKIWMFKLEMKIKLIVNLVRITYVLYEFPYDWVAHIKYFYAQLLNVKKIQKIQKI